MSWNFIARRTKYQSISNPLAAKMNYQSYNLESVEFGLPNFPTYAIWFISPIDTKHIRKFNDEPSPSSFVPSLTSYAKS